MALSNSGFETESNAFGEIGEQAFRSGLNVERAGRQARWAQGSAADSLDRSAQSQDRVAKSYEELAGKSRRSDRAEEYRRHAAIHRKFAQDDREMAERLRNVGGQ